MKAPVARPARTSDLTYQAEAFLPMLSRLPSEDPASAFMWWANPKDFSPRDRLAIESKVCKLLAEKGQPWTGEVSERAPSILSACRGVSLSSRGPHSRSPENGSP
jgi:hypothetical protein